jgi:hypothetical protein
MAELLNGEAQNTQSTSLSTNIREISMEEAVHLVFKQEITSMLRVPKISVSADPKPNFSLELLTRVAQLSKRPRESQESQLRERKWSIDPTLRKSRIESL